MFPSCLKDDSGSAKSSQIFHSSLLGSYRSTPAPLSGVTEGLIFPYLDIFLIAFPLALLLRLRVSYITSEVIFSYSEEILSLLYTGVPLPGKPLLVCTGGKGGYISSLYVPMTPCPPLPLVHGMPF